jgi:D-glycerate 3-kinase
MAQVPGRPFVLGINGPQGGGKTTLARELERRAGRAVAISIDDFYLTNADQKQLAARHRDNPLLQQRGYPGTHDVALGIETLAALRAARSGTVAIPVYDKAADSGRGDRVPRAQWREVAAPLDLIILEGWMLGFPRVDSPLTPHMQAVNELLPGYAPWHQFDAFLLLTMAEPRSVLTWRVEAERQLRAQSRGGMSEAETLAYIERFLPAYSVFPAALAAAPPVPADRFRTRRLGPRREVLD